MVNDMEMSVSVLPDWSEFDRESKDKSMEVDAEAGEVSRPATAGGGAGEKPRGPTQPQAKSQTSSLLLIGGLIGTVIGIIQTLTPIMALIELITNFLTLVFMPIALLLYKLLAPVLIWMMQVLAPIMGSLMGWLDAEFVKFYRFMDEVIQGIQNVVDAIIPPSVREGAGNAINSAMEGIAQYGLLGVLPPVWFAGAAQGIGRDIGEEITGRQAPEYHFNVEGITDSDTATVVVQKANNETKKFG